MEDQAKRLLHLNGIEESDLQEAVKSIRGGQTVQDQTPEDISGIGSQEGISLLNEKLLDTIGADPSSSIFKA